MRLAPDHAVGDLTRGGYRMHLSRTTVFLASLLLLSGVSSHFEEANSLDDEPADRFQEFIATEEGTVIMSMA